MNKNKPIPKSQVRKTPHGWQVYAAGPKGHIAQGQPHKDLGAAKRDAKKFEEVEIDEGPPSQKFKPLKHKVYSAAASIPKSAMPKDPGKPAKYKVGKSGTGFGAPTNEDKKKTKAEKKKELFKSRKYRFTTPGQDRDFETLDANRMFKSYEEVENEDAPTTSTAGVANWNPVLGGRKKEVDVYFKKRRNVDGRTKDYKETVQRVQARRDAATARELEQKLNMFGVQSNPFKEDTQMENKKYLKTKDGSIEDAVLHSMRREAPVNPNDARPTLHLPEKKYLDSKDGSLETAVTDVLVSEDKLSYKERQKLPSGDFALPGKGSGPEGKQGGSYPIPDESHARNALARVSQHGSEAEKLKVRRAVAKKFPSIKITETISGNMQVDLRKLPGKMFRLKYKMSKADAQRAGAGITQGKSVADVKAYEEHTPEEDAYDYKAKKGAIAAPGSGSIAKAKKAKASDVNKSIEQQMADARKEEVEKIREQLPVGHRQPSPGADSTGSYARLQDAKRRAKAAGKDFDKLPWGDQQKYHEEVEMKEGEWADEKRKEKESSDRLLKIHIERERRYQAQQAKKKQAKVEGTSVKNWTKNLPDHKTGEAKDKMAAPPGNLRKYGAAIKKNTKIPNTPVSEEEVEMDEAGATSKQVKMAKGIAWDKRHRGGDMTGAWKKAEKIKKGLGDHPKVQKALRKANEEDDRGVGSQAYTDYIRNLTPGETAVKDPEAEKASSASKRASAEKKRQVTKIDDAVDPEVAREREQFKKGSKDMRKQHILDVAAIKASKVGEEVIVGLLDLGIIQVNENTETGFEVINDPVANRENLLRMAYNTGVQILSEKKVSSDDYDHATALYKDQWKDRKIADYDKEHDRDSRAKEMRADAGEDRKRMYGLTQDKWKHAKYATGEEEGKKSVKGNTPDPKDAYKKEDVKMKGASFSGTPNTTHDPKFGQSIAIDPLEDKERVRKLPKGATTKAVQKKQVQTAPPKSTAEEKDNSFVQRAALAITLNKKIY